MPQMSPLYWPLIFSMLIYFLMTTKTTMSKFQLDTNNPLPKPISSTKKEMKW